MLGRYKRKLIQVLAACMFNLNIGGFVSGQIYKGASKSICAPGLNCYSCPGAVFACPIGSLSASLNNLDRSLPFYMLGTILAMGALFGRSICGWLCPLGLLQELLDKIPLPKLQKNKFSRAFTSCKYVVLVALVIVVPVVYWIYTGVAYPAFCAWLCPAGTIQAGWPLVAANEGLRMFLGALFTWKSALAVAFLVACMFIYRPFCRFLCPLGALLSLFNRVSILGYRINSNLCTNCGGCIKSCKMDVKCVSDRECIQCGKCKTNCPAGAIAFNLSGTKKTNKPEGS